MAIIPPGPSDCPICANPATKTAWSTQSETGEAFRFELCASCGSGYLNPPPTSAQLAHAYSRSYYGTGQTKFPSLIELFRNYCARHLATRLLRQLPQKPEVLDVGCGDGSFLALLKQSGAGHCHGIEPPGQAADRVAKIPGLILHRTTLAEAELPTGHFHLVTARHVFEHLPDPLDSLTRLASVVRPGGYLYLSLPNIQSWQAVLFHGTWFHLDAPRHLHLATAASIAAHLEAHSLHLIKTEHWSLEQSLFGWLQSALNACDSHRNFLYERLKGNQGYLSSRGPKYFSGHALFCAVLMLPALFIDGLSVLARRGATIQLTFQRQA